MPKKIIGREMVQEDLDDMCNRIRADHGVVDITVELYRTPNGWWAVQATCWRYGRGEGLKYSTHSTYITSRGPHMLTVMWKHLDALYHVVDRADSGLPPLIGI